MKSLERPQSWEATLADMRHQYATATDETLQEELQRKIAGLEKAIFMRSSLSVAASPKGKMEFSL